MVDDNAANRQLMQGIFDYLQISCEITSGGEEALAAIARATGNGQPFDLIITDHHMPVASAPAAFSVIEKQIRLSPLSSHNTQL